jgi:hypothetical protein
MDDQSITLCNVFWKVSNLGEVELEKDDGGCWVVYVKSARKRRKEAKRERKPRR